MKKNATLLKLIALSPLAGGLYGILNDQLTYTISPEYYTRFKFFLFGISDLGSEIIIQNPRIEAAAVGIIATWWIGLAVGTVLALIGLVHENEKHYFRTTIKSYGVVAAVALLSGLLGFAYGKYYLATHGVSWWLPENLNNSANFIGVHIMHKFSYFGALLGMLAGIIFNLKSKQEHPKKGSNRSKTHFADFSFNRKQSPSDNPA